MAERIRVGVIFGGQSGEHDVSLRSAHAVIEAMDPERFEIIPIGITRDGEWLVSGDPLAALAQTSQLSLPDASPQSNGRGNGVPVPIEDRERLGAMAIGWARELDVIFPVLHGPFGEDGTIQGMLELAGLPYVGAGVLASAVAMDKSITKRLLAHAGLPVVPWLDVLRRDWEREPEAVASRIQQEITYPCFVKPANLGSSVGISKVHDPTELAGAMAEASRYDRKIIVEAAIDARELEVSVLGNDDPEASVVGEIIPSREFYDYEAKYLDDRSELLIPAPLSDEQSHTVREAAIAAFQAIDCAGMARVDFFLDRVTAELFVNEINTIPGFTAISMYPKLWEASGLPLRALLSRLVDLALERHSQRDGHGR